MLNLGLYLFLYILLGIWQALSIWNLCFLLLENLLELFCWSFSCICFLRNHMIWLLELLIIVSLRTFSIYFLFLIIFNDILKLYLPNFLLSSSFLPVFPTSKSSLLFCSLPFSLYNILFFLWWMQCLIPFHFLLFSLFWCLVLCTPC